MPLDKQSDELQNFPETQGPTSIVQQPQPCESQGHELLEMNPISYQQIEHRRPQQNGYEDDPIVIITTTKSNNSSADLTDSITNMLKDPMIQLFGIVFILFLLTAILATINFCIWYLERRRRRVPLHWRSSPGVDVACSRPVSQTPKRSFHIQHALYKTVRRPSAMPP